MTKKTVLRKPFKTIDEQIKLLKARGIRTDENTRLILEREGYYPVVNGYKDIFIDKGASNQARDDRFKEGTSFSDIFKLYVFDRNLRMLFMSYFAKAEATLKTVCAYKFTEKYPIEKNPYLNLEHYNTKARETGNADRLIEKLKDAIGGNPKEQRWKTKSYLSHYVEQHDGEVPLWVLANFITLGQAFKFYDFMNDSMQNAIAKSFSRLYSNTHDKPLRINPRRLRLAYDHIKDFRNICAHDERLYCARVSPSNDITLVNVLRDLELVLSKEDHRKLITDFLALLIDLVQEVGPAIEILPMMGIDSIEEALLFTE